MVHVGGALSAWLRRKKLAGPMRPFLLVEQWKTIVGARIADRTRPSTLKDDTLIIAVTNSSWLNELNFLRSEIRRKVNHALDADVVKTIKLVIGPTELPSHPAEIRPGKKKRRFARTIGPVQECTAEDVKDAITRAMAAQQRNG